MVREIPESLCWHVLKGISNALLWLHTGCKHSFLSGYDMDQGDDWHPITMTEINPSKSENLLQSKAAC